MSDCGCETDTARAGTDPAYRRALWIVVVLNVGFGLLELVGGFIATRTETQQIHDHRQSRLALFGTRLARSLLRVIGIRQRNVLVR